MGFIISALALLVLCSVVQFFLRGKAKTFLILMLTFISTILTLGSAFGIIRTIDGSVFAVKLFNIDFPLVLDSLSGIFFIMVFLVYFLAVFIGQDVLTKTSKLNSFLIIFIGILTILNLISVDVVFSLICLLLLLVCVGLLVRPDKLDNSLCFGGILTLLGASVWTVISSRALDFLGMQSGLSAGVIALFAVGATASVSGVFRLAKKADNSLVKVLCYSVVAPIFIYFLVRMFCLWQNADELLAYFVLVSGFVIAFWGVNEVSKNNNVQGLVHKNYGMLIVALGVTMFGMLLRDLPITAVAMYALFFYLFNQVLVIPFSVFMNDDVPVVESRLTKFLPPNLFWYFIAIASLGFVPLFSTFIADMLLYNGVILASDSSNKILLVLMLFVISLVTIAEVLALKAIAVVLTKPLNIEGKSLLRNVVYFIFTLIILFVGLFPHVAIEFFVAPVFVFLGGNLEVPKDALANISTLNLSFLAMFVAVLLLRFVINKNLKLKEGK